MADPQGSRTQIQTQTPPQGEQPKFITHNYQTHKQFSEDEGYSTVAMPRQLR